ncbi:Nicolin-1 NPCEDRG Tubulin polyglutamylase complex subunit 5 [Larimichthys crocea]|uniref:Nicolin-1 NPCEDRG Tubulin polyglutamylase complex subunit 5 n=1 Tax=Larimichthys crocea TaxID=215358 RepID=A0A6G0J593_LARCR|nr:Nicolin-1 NPCEDRG Tubulin polyglutamylase complex subunit 5 [Larimichthys crocea]
MTSHPQQQYHAAGHTDTMSGSMDDIKPVSCTIKPPVYLHIGDTRTDPAHSGVCVVDVTLPFGKAVNIEEITFKNYYTAYVTVRLLRRSPGQEVPAKWCTALRDLPLMANPHTEGGSQDYYSIHRMQTTVCTVDELDGDMSPMNQLQIHDEKKSYF